MKKGNFHMIFLDISFPHILMLPIYGYTPQSQPAFTRSYNPQHQDLPCIQYVRLL